jgi:predicted nucleotidyltransferase
MDDESHDDGAPEELASREPSVEDVVQICRELNARGARYIVVGGFAIRQAGYSRTTADIDLLVDPAPGNETKVFAALATLPDGAVRELDAGDVEKFTVVRVSDEVMVDLMAKASGISYEEAKPHIHVRELDGVTIPFANPDLLWRMKSRSSRPKDQGDLFFLRELFAAEGRQPPDA